MRPPGSSTVGERRHGRRRYPRRRPVAQVRTHRAGPRCSRSTDPSWPGAVTVLADQPEWLAVTSATDRGRPRPIVTGAFGPKSVRSYQRSTTTRSLDRRRELVEDWLESRSAYRAGRRRDAGHARRRPTLDGASTVDYARPRRRTRARSADAAIATGRRAGTGVDRLVAPERPDGCRRAWMHRRRCETPIRRQPRHRHDRLLDRGRRDAPSCRLEATRAETSCSWLPGAESETIRQLSAGQRRAGARLGSLRST